MPATHAAASRMATLGIACCALLLVLLPLLAAGQPLGRAFPSYSLHSAAASDPAATIPAAFRYVESQVAWQQAYLSSELDAWRTEWDWCWKALPLRFNFTAFGARTDRVWISPAGLMYFTHGVPVSDYTCAVTIYPSCFDKTWPAPMPDARLPPSDGGSARSYLAWGFNYDHLWDATEFNESAPLAGQHPSMQYATIVSPADGSSIFLLRGALASFPNASHPTYGSTYDFQIQLHEATREVILHMQSLTNATRLDIAKPFSIGMVNYTFDPNVAYLEQASVFMQNVFAESSFTAATVRWTPFDNSESCILGNGTCHTCLATPGCSWCASSQNCVDTGMLGAASCAVVSSTCPVSEWLTCASCTQAGFKWCSGMADCAFIGGVTPAADDQTLCTMDLQPSQRSAGALVGQCVELSTACGSRSCAEATPYTHSHCDVSQRFTDQQCVCNALYTNDFDPQHDSTADQLLVGTCSLCDYANSHVFKDDDGDCALCPELSAGLIMGFIAIGGVLTFALVKLNSHPLFVKLMVPVQNSIVYFQVLSLLSLIDFHWPLSIRRAFVGFSVAGLNIFHLPTVSCWLTDDEARLASLLAPIVIGSFLLVCMAAVATLAHVRRARGTINSLAAGDFIAVNRVLFVRTYISFLMLYYNFICLACLNGLASTNWLVALHKVLRSYDDVTNTYGPYHYDDTERRRAFELIFATIIYVVGTPLLFLVILAPQSRWNWIASYVQCTACCRTKALRKEAVEPLVSKYRIGYSQYWEALFVPLWKVVLSVLIVFAPRAAQISGIAVLLLLLVLCYAFLKPYNVGLNNREQQYLLTGSLVILLGGLMFFFSSPADSPRKLALEILSYIVVLATMAVMLVLVVYVLGSVVRDHYRESKQVAASEQLLSGADNASEAGEKEMDEYEPAKDVVVTKGILEPSFYYPPSVRPAPSAAIDVRSDSLASSIVGSSPPMGTPIGTGSVFPEFGSGRDNADDDVPLAESHKEEEAWD